MVTHIEVYELRREEGAVLLDESRLHCVISVQDKKPEFQFSRHDKEDLIRSLFNRAGREARKKSSGLDCGGVRANGTHWDGSFIDFEPWSRELIESIVLSDLRHHNLGSKVWFGEADVKPLVSVGDADNPVCPNCGRPSPKLYRFCMYCGIDRNKAI